MALPLFTFRLLVVIRERTSGNHAYAEHPGQHRRHKFLPLENAHSSLLAALAEFERSRDPLIRHPLALVVPRLANPRAVRTDGHPVCLNLKTIASFHSPAVTNDVRVPRRSGLTHSAVNFGTSCRLALRVSHPLNKDEKKEDAGKQTKRC